MNEGFNLASTKNIIEKWYKKLEFPTEYDKEFYNYLSTIEIEHSTTIDNYDFTCEDGGKNLLSFLYMCEKVQDLYNQKGIPEDVLIDTLKDIVTWTKTYTSLKNKLYLGEIFWLKRHMTCRIFKLGRLQFAIGTSRLDSPKHKLKIGDKFIEIHIPEGEKLSIQECEKSLARAKEFFHKFFPEIDFNYFICHSWLLDENLNKYLNENSNILQFASMFKVIDKQESTAILKFIFGWDTTIDNLASKIPQSTFATKIKNAVLSGEKFYESFGLLKK